MQYIYALNLYLISKSAFHVFQIRKLDDSEFKNPWTRTYIRVFIFNDNMKIWLVCFTSFIYLFVFFMLGERIQAWFIKKPEQKQES